MMFNLMKQVGHVIFNSSIFILHLFLKILIINVLILHGRNVELPSTCYVWCNIDNIELSQMVKSDEVLRLGNFLNHM